MEDLRQQVMLNQFVSAAGCDRDTAVLCLDRAQWQFEMALSLYFQEAAIPRNDRAPAGCPLLPPTNTPATPPNFPDALTMFSQMSTADTAGPSSPQLLASVSPRAGHLAQQAAAWPPPTQGSPVTRGSVVAPEGGRAAMVPDHNSSWDGQDFLQFPLGAPDGGLQQQQQQQQQRLRAMSGDRGVEAGRNNTCNDNAYISPSGGSPFASAQPQTQTGMLEQF